MAETTIKLVESPAPKDVDEALLMLQADLPVLVKDKAGQVGNQRTRYADLVQANAVIMPRLNALGLVWKTKPTLRAEEPKFVLTYELKHVPSGTSEAGFYPLKLSEQPMQMGSAITYARRYALLCVTGVVSEDEDDDGQAASGQRYAQRAAQPARSARREPAGEQRQTAQRARQAPRGARPALPGEDPDGPVGQDQHRQMHALWRDLGYGGEEHRESRLRITASLVGLAGLESSASLTRGQADQVIAKLRERKDDMAAEAGAEP